MTENKLYDFGTNSVVPVSEVSEGGNYRLFDPGIYDYTVIGFKRVRNEKTGGKIPNKAWGAKLTFLLTASNGETTRVDKTFWLVQNLAWMTGKFCRSCRLRTHDDPIDFNQLELAKQRSCTGRLKLKHRVYDTKTYNEIEDFIIPDEDAETDAAADQEPDEDTF